MFLNCKCPIYQIHDDKGLPNDDKRLGEEDDDVVASLLFIYNWQSHDKDLGKEKF